MKTTSLIDKYFQPVIDEAFEQVRLFEQDLLAMFTHKRQGHMEKWAYAEADFHNDPASGQYFWEVLIKNPGSYYLPRADINMLSQASHHSGINATLRDTHTVVELGPGSLESISKKTIPFLQYAKEYIAVDNCVSQAQQAANQVQATLGISASILKDDYLRPSITKEGRPKTAFVMWGASLGNIEGRANEDPQPRLIKALSSLADCCNKGDSVFISIDTEMRGDIVMDAYNVPMMSKKIESILHDAKRLGIVKGKFTPEAWTHRCLWHGQASQGANYLIPGADQDFMLAGQRIQIPVGKATIAINSYKFSASTIETAARAAGFSRVFVSNDKPMALLMAIK